MKLPLLVLLSLLAFFSSVPTAKPAAKIEDAELHFSERKVSALPSPLRRVLVAYADEDWGLIFDDPAQSINVCRFDLNADGVPEYFFEAPGGYSGGPETVVIQKQKDHFTVIAGFQGGYGFGPGRSEGYLNITAYARRGGNNYAHQTLHFSHGKYQVHVAHETIDGKRKE